MKAILNQLNYAVSENSKTGNVLKLLVVNNPDGSPRWICKADENKPHFLKFYASNNLRAKLFTVAIRIIFILRLQRFVFQTVEIVVEKKSNEIEPIIDLFSENWALFTGTVGPNRKLIIYTANKNEEKFFKIGITPQSNSLLLNEANAINKVNNLFPEQFIVPKVYNHNRNVLVLEDISIGTSSTLQFTNAHRNFLGELATKTSHSTNLYSLIKEHNLFGKLAAINLNKDNRIPQGIGRKLNLLLNSMKNEEVQATMCHGDFTPWNCFVKEEKLAVYDWELSGSAMPLGFDLFHFFMQKGILTERKSWAEISKEMKGILSDGNMTFLFNSNEEELNKYLKFYLIFNTINYLTTYSEQEHWHVQIHWLINTWNEALSDILSEGKSHRELLIMDVFDFLNSKNYATIKFPDSFPEKLSQYSDIDMCIEKKDWKDINKMLRAHPLIAGFDIANKSYMNSVQIMLADGNFLSIDFLWKFKRKSLTMLNHVSVIKEATMNIFGVKLMSDMDTARYLIMFYGLNNAAIPMKYRHYIKSLASSQNKFDQKILNAINNYKPDNTELTKLLRKQPENNPIKTILNTIIYIFDSIHSLISRKGFIITFSGVDGAGKSTIIEKTKYEIEKKLRRNVVVLRHRPSLLPILSAITKGKAKAESEAAQKLPRQGSNFGKVSSLLRFAYYFTDYLFGQFYIYLKYTLRGTVVLYDRYYFDFIVDSRRSNITISEKLVRFGYKFLMKPDLNFFLYADVATILKRKQELSATTIVELTNKYKKLFFELDFAADHKKLKYESIENIDLKDTISRILKNTITVAA